MWSRWMRVKPAVVLPVEHALQGRLDARAACPDLPRGQPGQDAGSRSPPASASRMRRADLTLASDDTADDSFTSAPSSSFSSRCHSRVRSRTSWPARWRPSRPTGAICGSTASWRQPSLTGRVRATALPTLLFVSSFGIPGQWMMH